MSVLKRVLLSFLAVGGAIVVALFIFLSLPINWEVSSIWISWSAMFQNGALVLEVLIVSALSLRAIWRRKRAPALEQ